MALTDEEYMKIALEEARAAARDGEVPVGAVVVCEGEIVSRAHNQRERMKLATAHAEILAVNEACLALGRRTLSDCTLYVTLEPCPMCAGALVGARIGRIVYGAKDARAGACGSMLNLFSYPLEASPEITDGVMKKEALALLQDFFVNRRKKKG